MPELPDGFFRIGFLEKESLCQQISLKRLFPKITGWEYPFNVGVEESIGELNASIRQWTADFNDRCVSILLKLDARWSYKQFPCSILAGMFKISSFYFDCPFFIFLPTSHHWTLRYALGWLLFSNFEFSSPPPPRIVPNNKKNMCKVWVQSDNGKRCPWALEHLNNHLTAHEVDFI